MARLKVKYRVVDERTGSGGWETVGVIVFWESAAPHLQLRGIMQHTVSTSIWRVILARVKEQHLTLETYHLALHGFEQDYRIHPQILECEAESAAEIRRQLSDKYVYYAEAMAVLQPIAA